MLCQSGLAKEFFFWAPRGPARDREGRSPKLSAPGGMGAAAVTEEVRDAHQHGEDWDTSSSLQTSQQRWRLVPPTCQWSSYLSRADPCRVRDCSLFSSLGLPAFNYSDYLTCAVHVWLLLCAGPPASPVTLPGVCSKLVLTPHGELSKIPWKGSACRLLLFPFFFRLSRT